MGIIDWDKAAEGKSVLEPGGNQQSYMMGESGPVPVGTATPLPEIGGLFGGILGAGLTKSPAGGRAGMTAGQALVRTLIPSLAGSTAGTVVGLGGESLFTPVSGQRAASALVENALWDVGGNLAFTVGGKAIRLSKDALDALGITRASTFDDARRAAQLYLEKQGATLTRGQLTQSPVDKLLESLSSSGTGADIFTKQQAKVTEAISKGTQDVLNTLDTSPAFKAALKADEPLTRAAGENFQALIDTARTEFKDKYRPFYDSLSQNYGVFVDMRPIKKAAEDELKQISRIKDVKAASARKEVLDQVIKQDDAIEFGAAHDLLSAFKSSAADAVVPGAGTTAQGATYKQFAKKIEGQMDNIIDLSEKKLGKDLVNEYRNVTTKYREGMEGLFNGTINQAMKEAPSKTGAYIFDLADTGKSTELFQAVSEVDKYVKNVGKQSTQVVNDFKYGFLEQALSTPEKTAKFAESLDTNPEMRRAFYKLFKNESKDLQELLNAAKIGLENLPGDGGTYLRNKGIILGGQALTLPLAYVALPNEVTDKVNLPEALATAGLFIITPRLVAKATTNKEAVSALADLSRASSNPKFGGAAAAKIADRLNASGIIDAEYINEVNSLLGSPDARQSAQPTALPTTGGGGINWEGAVE